MGSRRQVPEGELSGGIATRAAAGRAQDESQGSLGSAASRVVTARRGAERHRFNFFLLPRPPPASGVRRVALREAAPTGWLLLDRPSIVLRLSSTGTRNLTSDWTLCSAIRFGQRLSPRPPSYSSGHVLIWAHRISTRSRARACGHTKCGPRFVDAPHFSICNLWIAGFHKVF
jgi:hypothetical protein